MKPVRPAPWDWMFVAAAAVTPLVLMYGNKAMVGVLAALGLAALPRLAAGAWRSGWPVPVLACFALLLAWGGASLAWAHVPGLVMPKLLQLVGLALPGLAACRAASELDDFMRRRVMLALAGGAALAAGAALVEAASGLALSRVLRPLLTGNAWEPGAVEMSTYKNLASAGAVPMIAGFAAAWAAGARRAALVIAAAAAAAAWATSNITGAMALGAAGIVALAPRRVAAGLVGLAMAGLALAVPLAHLLPGSAELVRILPFLPNSLMHRAEIWRFAAERAWERPFLGWGLDGSREIPGGGADVTVWVRDAAGPTSFPVQVLPLHPHDFLLQVWLELGFVGLGLALALCLALLWAARRSRAALAALAAGVAVAAASFSLWQSWWNATLWLSAALTLAMMAPNRRKQP